MATKVVFLTSTGSWTVPADFSSLVSIEAIGAGSGGDTGGVFNGGGGGGGGAYAAITSLAGLSAGATVYVSIGAGGGAGSGGGDTWFNGSTNAAPASTTDGVLAKGGANGASSTGGAGGSGASSIGDTTYSGGDGGNGASFGSTSGGGGGTAGPSGAGSNASGTANYLGGAANGGALTQADTAQGGAGTAGAIYTQTSDSATAGPGTGGNGRLTGSGPGGAGGAQGGGGGGGSSGGFSGGAGANGIVIFTYTAAGVSGDLNATQTGDTVSASGAVGVAADAVLTQAGDTVSAAAAVGVISSASLAVTQDGQTVAAIASQPLFVAAPSYGYWLKTQERKKPKPPRLPEPMHPTDVVIDEAVLRQMEEERLAALVLKAKQDALRRVEELRAYEFEKKPSRLIGLGREVADQKPVAPARLIRLERREQPEPEQSVRRTVTLAREADPVETSPEIRRRVISLFRSPETEPLKELVPNYNKLRVMGPRRLPSPEIAKAKTISLRRPSSQAQHETRR